MKENYYQNNFTGNPIYPGNTAVPNEQNNIPYNDSLRVEQPYVSQYYTEQPYMENLLKLNKGKKVEVYMTFPNSSEYKDKVFPGIIEQSGKDYIILSDPTNGKWFLLLMFYVDYIKFDEKINYG